MSEEKINLYDKLCNEKTKRNNQIVALIGMIIAFGGVITLLILSIFYNIDYNSITGWTIIGISIGGLTLLIIMYIYRLRICEEK